MTHGFDLNDDLVCEGIIGDGCGGGRIFFIKENSLYVHDPVTKEEMKLYGEFKESQKITKKGCQITITCSKKTLVFDLSKMELV